MQQLDYNSGRAVFSMWSVPGCQFNQFCTGICEDRTWARDRGIAIVEAFTKKRLVTDWEHYIVYCSGLWSVELAIVL
jgi:hypothetical protein